MKENRIYYERNLPHYQPHGYAFFITTRLAGTIPKNVYEKLKKEYNHELSMLSGLKNLAQRRRLYNELQESSFIKYDSILDRKSYGRKWLGNKAVASLVKKSLHFYENKEYELYTYTIMPSHLHLIIKPILKNDQEPETNSDNSYFLITKILKSIKMFTGREANKILKRTGQFWQHESYDHVIRSNVELIRLTEYILDNPVKAKLCNSREDWSWSYINSDLYNL